MEQSICASDMLDKEISGSSASFKLSLWVPTEAVGKVIGKKGAVIQHLQRETDTTCSIASSLTHSGDSSAGDNSLWSPIVITGDPSKALIAHDMIQDIVEDIDDAVAEFSLPPHQLPHKYSPYRGFPSDAVQLLSAETNVRIGVPEKRESSHKTRDRDGPSSIIDLVITMEGEVTNIFKALTRFAAALSNHRHVSSKNPDIPQPDSGCRFIGESSGDVNNESDSWRRRDKEGIEGEVLNFEKLVNIPASLVGLLLAKRDADPSVMKQIQRSSRTMIVRMSEPVLPVEINDDTNAKNEFINMNDVCEETDTDKDNNNTQDSTVKGKSKKTKRFIETFAVRGHLSQSVELAASCLLRIVTGDKIVSVLADLNAQKNRERVYSKAPSASRTSRSRVPVLPSEDKKFLKGDNSESKEKAVGGKNEVNGTDVALSDGAQTTPVQGKRVDVDGRGGRGRGRGSKGGRGGTKAGTSGKKIDNPHPDTDQA